MVRYHVQKLRNLSLSCRNDLRYYCEAEDLTLCGCLCSNVSHLRPAALPAALSDILGDLHLLPGVFYHHRPHSHSSHLQTLLRPEEE